MSAALLQRQLALGGVALLATLGSLALSGRDAGVDAEPVPAAGGGWYEAVASSLGPDYGRTTACGIQLTAETRGVAHPFLPCGAKIFLSYRGRQVFAQVVERGPREEGRGLELTEALARELGFEGVQVVRWRFAGER